MAPDTDMPGEDNPSPPKSFDDLKAAVTERYPGLSGQLQRIARYLLENPEDSAFATVTSIAGHVDVQPSSLVRFAKAFGYDGFSAMQKVFRSRLISEAPTYRERLRNLRQQRTPEAGAESVLNDFIDEGMAALEQLRQHFDTEAVNAATAMLTEAETVYILARGRAFPVAFYIAYALTGLEKPCRLLDGVGGLTEREARLATAKDALVAVSFRPYSPDVIELVEVLSKAGVQTVAITDSPVSPLALVADAVLETREEERRAFRTLTAPMCLAQTLVMNVGHELIARSGNG